MRYLFALALALPVPALAEVPRVMTDLPAVHSLTAQVMGDLGAPGVLLEQGANAHDYQLKPSQAAALQAADLVIWVGPQMTPWLGRAIEGVAPTGVRLELLGAEPTLRRDFGQTNGAPGHEDEDHADDAHDHAGLDPHAWLDPENGRIWLGLIAAALSAQDPDNAAAYAANATAAQAGIAALDAELGAVLAPVADKPFVVFHDAYGYFSAHYGLSVAGSVALGDAAAPGAAHLADLRRVLTENRVVCAFPEAQHDPKQVALLTEGTPVAIGGPLDPSGSNLEYGTQLYPALLRNLAETLVDCLADG